MWSWQRRWCCDTSPGQEGRPVRRGCSSGLKLICICSPEHSNTWPAGRSPVVSSTPLNSLLFIPGRQPPKRPEFCFVHWGVENREFLPACQYDIIHSTPQCRSHWRSSQAKHPCHQMCRTLSTKYVLAVGVGTELDEDKNILKNSPTFTSSSGIFTCWKKWMRF